MMMSRAVESHIALLEATVAGLRVTIDGLKELQSEAQELQVQREAEPSGNGNGWADYPPVLSLAEAARVCGWSGSTAVKMSRRKGFPGTKHNRHWSIDRDRLRDWVSGFTR